MNAKKVVWEGSRRFNRMQILWESGDKSAGRGGKMNN